MWPDEIHRELSASGVRVVGYVPDAGHKRLIELCRADKKMRAVVLTSSGVGNVINVLGMVRECRFPLVTLVTMRGEQGEFNPWQVPMGQAVRTVLEAMGTVVQYVEKEDQVAPVVNAAFRLAYNSYASVAVLISQRLIGIKSFQEQAAK
jgi:sulfopyruvate decarboxylase TPP-binding subunit